MGRSEDEKVGGKARLRDGEAEESGELGEQTVLWIGNHIYLAS